MENNEGSIKKMRDTLAAIQSIIPGLGHIYKGYYYQGIVLVILSLSVFYMGAVLFLATAGFSMLFPLIFIILVGLHAYFAEDRRKHHIGIL